MLVGCTRRTIKKNEDICAHVLDSHALPARKLPKPVLKPLTLQEKWRQGVIRIVPKDLSNLRWDELHSLFDHIEWYCDVAPTHADRLWAKQIFQSIEQTAQEELLRQEVSA